MRLGREVRADDRAGVVRADLPGDVDHVADAEALRDPDRRVAVGLGADRDGGQGGTWIRPSAARTALPERVTAVPSTRSRSRLGRPSACPCSISTSGPGQRAGLDQPPRERSRGGARRRVLPQADGRIEEPRIGLRPVQRVQVAPLGAGVGEHALERGRVRRGAVHGLPVGGGDQQVGRPGGDDAAGADVPGLEGERRGDGGGGHGLLRRDGLPLAHRDQQAVAVALDPQRQLVGADLLDMVARADLTVVGEPPPRPERVVAGAADLGPAGRERPQAAGGRAGAGQHERRLGLVELPGDVGEHVVAQSVVRRRRRRAGCR